MAHEPQSAMSRTVAAGAAIVLFLFSHSVRSDVYPGDTQYNQICEWIVNNVAANSIPLYQYNLGSSPATYNRNQLCTELTHRHNYGSSGGAPQTNSEFLLGSSSGYISGTACASAMASPSASGYQSSSAGWQSWAGIHQGSW